MIIKDYHASDAVGYGVDLLNGMMLSRKLERAMKGREQTDTATRERLRTLILWEAKKRINLFGIDHGDMQGMPEVTKKLTWQNTSGCWIVGAPLAIFQEHRYVFPSEGLFAQIALALEAGVGQDG